VLCPHGQERSPGAVCNWPDSLVTVAEVEHLLNVLDLRGVLGVVDHWDHGTGVRDALGQRDLPLVTCSAMGNTEVNFQLDMLQLDSFEQVRKAGVCLDVVNSSPWFVLLDLALPMAV
jgi:hypothetical protein